MRSDGSKKIWGITTLEDSSSQAANSLIQQSFFLTEDITKPNYTTRESKRYKLQIFNN